MTKKSKKTAKKTERKGVFSTGLTRAIASTARKLLADGRLCVTREEVAAVLLKEDSFTEDNAQLLTVMVGEAVKHGEVSGFASRRGPGGGIYNISQYDKALAAE